MYITASTLYNYIQCPHRVWRDYWGPQDEKLQETNAFVELLWTKGVLHEQNVIQNIGEFVDLSQGPIEDRVKRTVTELKKGTPLIYQGVLCHGDLLGIPDLLKKVSEGVYIPIDIKSGRGVEGAEDSEEAENSRPKKHYAVQLCLYIEILKHYGLAKDNRGMVIDITGEEVEYLMDQPQGTKTPFTWWQFYEQVKKEVRALLDKTKQNKPAWASICKLCPWYMSCKKWCKSTDDLTNIFFLGRTKRDTMSQDLGISKVKELCSINVERLMFEKSKNKNFLKGFGESTLTQLKKRANILALTKKPVIFGQLEFPRVSVELFFDIEDDPTQDFVYLHGVYERSISGSKFIDFTAKGNTPDAEKEAWQRFWDYIRDLPLDDYAVYYYSHHEKTTYKRLRKKYPEVISDEELTAFFDSPKAIDLYKVVLKHTDWPVSSYSLKELATYLGFKWRDETPSGALSIQWYNDYLKTGDQKILNRILEYNEDDCRATMVVKDGIVQLLKK